MSSEAFQYIKVDWIHTHPDEPTVLYSELDMDRWELRKVEVYVDGTMDFADAERSSGTTQLGSLPVTPLEELTSEFDPKVIYAAEFERVWSMATK
jgi:hypothetical protein